MAKSNHYVDNEKLLKVISEYRIKYFKAKEAGTELPRVPEYIGVCLLQIADGLGQNRNFRNYSYLDTMKSDGIENCIRYCHNFDPERTKNPFAYFTQIIYYAFLRRIDIEHKAAYMKYKVMERSVIYNTLVELAPGDQEQFQAAISSMMDETKYAALCEKYDKKPNPRKKKKVGIEQLIEEDDDTV